MGSKVHKQIDDWLKSKREASVSSAPPVDKAANERLVADALKSGTVKVEKLPPGKKPKTKVGGPNKLGRWN